MGDPHIDFLQSLVVGSPEGSHGTTLDVLETDGPNDEEWITFVPPAANLHEGHVFLSCDSEDVISLAEDPSREEIPSR